MILVTLGTQDKEFKRLLIEIERLIKIDKINEKVVAQIGNTKFTTQLSKEKLELIDFMSLNELQNLIKQSSFIITHGGVATIIEALNFNKKIIAVPRLKQYKEHVNDHQLQIIENFGAKGYIIGTKGVEDIENALIKVEKFYPQKYESNNSKFLECLEKEIKKENQL